jgi:hypothetical protein
MVKYTTLRVSETTRDEFNAEGIRGETSDDLLMRLLKELRERRRVSG